MKYNNQTHCFRRHKQVLKRENPGMRIALLENEHSKSFAKWLHKEVINLMLFIIEFLFFIFFYFYIFLQI